MRCTLHLNRPAAGYCCGCGNFFCESCLRSCDEDKKYCFVCMKKLNKAAKVEEGAARDGRLAVKLVVKSKTGRSLKGTSYMVDPARDGFHFIRRTSRGTDEEMYMEFSDVQYVAIVESLTGARRTSPGEYQPKGSEVAVIFKDGERIDGYTLRHYNANEQLFSVIPTDAHDNRISILVRRDAVASMTLGRIPKAQELRKLVANPVRRLILHYYWRHPDIVITIEELAARLERTVSAVERELPEFVQESLIKPIGPATRRQLKFAPSGDHIVRETIASMGKEIDTLYFRRRPPTKPSSSGRRSGGSVRGRGVR